VTKAEGRARARFRRMRCLACGLQTVIMGTYSNSPAEWRGAFEPAHQRRRTPRCRRIRIEELTAEQAAAEVRARANQRKAATSQ